MCENVWQDQVDIEVLEVVSSSIDVLCGVESIEDQQMTIFDIQKFPEWMKKTHSWLGKISIQCHDDF